MAIHSHLPHSQARMVVPLASEYALGLFTEDGLTHFIFLSKMV